ncbi:GTP-binding protein Rhes [Denticeps clupeoides]|uniref:Small monomeric GTPase n=1 Tax=Denticeps clupeoides TaxID=299321 RepID=A0AAY4BQB5_9TELE|nr:GTP-binding protein Rhes-like [Denticeps clupeoides]
MEVRLLSPSAMLLQYGSAARRLSGLDVSKARVGIAKTVTTNWRREKKARVARSSSASDGVSKRSAETLLRVDPRPRNRRRIVVLGAPRVGKTAVLRRFLRDDFDEQYVPTSEDFHSKVYRIRGETYQVDILDASKERDFPAKRRLSILTGDIFLLVFSVDDRESFDEVRALRKEIQVAKSKLGGWKENSRVPVVFCANKVDLGEKSRAVEPSEICRGLGRDAAVFETSARDGTRLDEMFEALADLGGLPAETRPSLHRDVSIRSYEAQHGRRRSRREAACGAVFPLARRPSFGSDLRRVLGPGPSKRSAPMERCQIQ